jgi:hypothetical protein
VHFLIEFNGRWKYRGERDSEEGKDSEGEGAKIVREMRKDGDISEQG